MSEKGGRYFREARFFLLGNKFVAQSHVLEARAMLGHLSDLHAMGGPPIQVNHTTLQDGTQIKAVMMNGQYQAEIFSPQVSVKRACVRVPTIFGYRTYDQNLSTEYRVAFMWQKATGIVYLPTPTGYLIGGGLDIPPTISMDGLIISSDVFPPGVGAIAQFVIWYADGSYEVLTGANAISHLMDVRYGSVEPILAPAASSGNMLDWHRYIRVPPDECEMTGSHLIFGRLFQSGGSRGATVERSGTSIANDVLTVLDLLVTLPSSLVTGGDLSGNLLVGWSGEDASGDDISVKWERTDRNSPYVKTELGNGLRSNAFVSDDGKTFAASVVQHRFNSSALPLLDSVPAVWTEADGLVVLDPFIYPPGDTTNAFQYDELYGVASDGLMAVGGRSDVGPLAWEKVDGIWRVIPALDRQFNGMCLAVN